MTSGGNGTNNLFNKVVNMSKAEDWKDTVTLTRKEYEELCDRDHKLQCLENAGVDNWEWYGDAMEAYNDE